jgi:peptidoglycan/xylan/chitin deacetylase (PgdA/CDA1 family)
MLLIALVIIAVLLVVAYWLFMSPFSNFIWKIPFKGETHDKLVALTFDDGPNEPYTTEILDFLNSKKIKATFFEVGKNIEKFPGTTKKIYAAGHVIANHSLSHEFHRYFLEPSFKNEIESTQAIIKNTIGKSPALYRSPWLWRQPILLNTLKKNSLHPISGVFCNPIEVLQPNGQQIAKTALAKIKPGAIIIFHDGFDSRGGNRSQTVKAVKLTVEELLKNGYKFVTVDKLLGLAPYQ